MKVAVTGASGFVGGAACTALSAAGYDLVRVDLRSEAAATFEGCDVVVHLAAIAHRHAKPTEIERVNVTLAREVGEQAAAAGARLVYVSSVKVHGEASLTPFTEDSPFAPRDIYGRSKARAEEALRAVAGLRLAVLRPPLVYGPGVKANFLALMKAVARGIPLPFGSVSNRRSLIYVGNLADAIVRCLDRDGTFLVSDGPACATGELCRAIGRVLGKPARLFPFPPAFLPGKLAGSLEVDDRRIRQVLGWRPPASFEEGLLATAHWYRSL
jgi:nucleoside-diphosphate-sugar epimerase